MGSIRAQNRLAPRSIERVTGPRRCSHRTSAEAMTPPGGAPLMALDMHLVGGRHAHQDGQDGMAVSVEARVPFLMPPGGFVASVPLRSSTALERCSSPCRSALLPLRNRRHRLQILGAWVSGRSEFRARYAARPAGPAPRWIDTARLKEPCSGRGGRRPLSNNRYGRCCSRLWAGVPGLKAECGMRNFWESVLPGSQLHSALGRR
jgi:hypothetical protein